MPVNMIYSLCCFHTQKPSHSTPKIWVRRFYLITWASVQTTHGGDIWRGVRYQERYPI